MTLLCDKCDTELPSSCDNPISCQGPECSGNHLCYTCAVAADDSSVKA